MPLKIRTTVIQHNAAGQISRVSTDSLLSTYPLHSRDQVAGTAEDAAELAAKFNAAVQHAPGQAEVTLLGDPPSGYVLTNGLLVLDE